MISDAKVLRVLVNEYLSLTTGSELLLLHTLVQIIGRYLVTDISLDDNELFMTKCPPGTDTILFIIDMKLTTTTAWRWSCIDKTDRNKKTAYKSQLLKWSES